MKPEITLTVSDDQGGSRQVTIRSSRFTIGRSPDNDLILDDNTLSRRHALIESFDGIAQISDCGSENGTMLNGKLLITAAALHDGDTISIGYDCRIRVRITHASPDDAASSSPDKKPEKDLRSPTEPSPLLNANSISLTAVAIILLALVSGLVILRQNGGGQSSQQQSSQQQSSQQQSDANPGDRPAIIAAPKQEPKSEAEALEHQTGEAAERLMLGISSDRQPYYFPREAWPDIKRKLQQYSKSTALPGTLRLMKQRSKELASLCKNDSIELNILSYAALAKTMGGQSGDPLMVARQMLPDLQYLRITFGDKTADGSLILVAALVTGHGQTRWHPLLNAISKIEKVADRNIWYLRKNGKLNEEIYDFVLSFLALGIIAQDPHQFQVDADPLKF